MKKLISLIALLTLQSVAHATEVSVLAGLNFGAPSISYRSAAQQNTATGALAYGVLCAVPLLPSLEFESGFIHEDLSYTYNDGVATHDLQFSEIQIPFLLRYKLDPLVGIGVGPYWGIGTGKILERTSGVTRGETFSDANLYSNDFGVVFNVHALIPIASHFALTVDGRFQLGFEERAKEVDLASYKTRSVQALAGMSYLF